MRAAFYYGWYPEQWAKAGSRYTPVLGRYSSSHQDTINSHIDQMQYAKIDAGIHSWWGQGSPTDERFQQALDLAAQKGFKWAIYYEQDYNGQASWYFRVKPDLKYLRKYFSHPAYLRVNGKPVVFVYNPTSSIKNAAKWVKARNEFSLYISLDDYPEWWISNPVDAWHGYRPHERIRAVHADGRIYSIAISAGFYAAGESAPRLSRDYEAFKNALGAWKIYPPEWELVYFNEWGEGTGIEPSDAQCEQYLCSDYLSALRQE